MRRLLTAILATGIALVFVFYMITYTVAYNQTAIITTFDKATDPSPDALANNKDSGSVMLEPGLKFKWPWPIQRVQTYPTQLQVLDDTPEQLQLSDGNTVIINLTLTWRISDPLAFFKSLGTLEKANDTLRAQMRDQRSVISEFYGFADLVNEDPSRVKLDEIEQSIAQRLHDQLTNIQPSYGIEVSGVSISKLLYTESTAASVNARMTAAQNARAEEIRAEGVSQANAIRTEAESASRQIRAFADNVATGIRNIGDREATAFIKLYANSQEEEDLARYLRMLEALEQILSNRSKFILDARTFTPLDVFVYGPGQPGNLSRVNLQPGPAGQGPTPDRDAGEQARLHRIEQMEEEVQRLTNEINRMRASAMPLRENAGGPTEPTSTEARP